MLTPKGKKLNKLIGRIYSLVGKEDGELVKWYIEALEGYARDYYNPWYAQLLGIEYFPEEIIKDEKD